MIIDESVSYTHLNIHSRHHFSVFPFAIPEYFGFVWIKIFSCKNQISPPIINRQVAYDQRFIICVDFELIIIGLTIDIDNIWYSDICKSGRGDGMGF